MHPLTVPLSFFSILHFFFNYFVFLSALALSNLRLCRLTLSPLSLPHVVACAHFLTHPRISVVPQSCYIISPSTSTLFETSTVINDFLSSQPFSYHAIVGSWDCFLLILVWDCFWWCCYKIMRFNFSSLVVFMFLWLFLKLIVKIMTFKFSPSNPDWHVVTTGSETKEVGEGMRNWKWYSFAQKERQYFSFSFNSPNPFNMEFDIPSHI